MNHKNRTMLQRLVIELDDSRNLYLDLACMPLSTHAKYLVQRIVLAHCAIAEDLADQMHAISSQVVRRDGVLGKLRARYGAWRANAGANVELGCLSQIERYERRILERFVTTAKHASEMQQRLYRHLDELEFLSAQVASALDEVVDIRSSRRALRATGAIDRRLTPETNNVSSRQAPDALRHRRSQGEKRDRSAPHRATESADAVGNVTAARTLANHGTLPSETLISPAGFHAASETHHTARIRSFHQND